MKFVVQKLWEAYYQEYPSKNNVVEFFASPNIRRNFLFTRSFRIENKSNAKFICDQNLFSFFDASVCTSLENGEEVAIRLGISFFHLILAEFHMQTKTYNFRIGLNSFSECKWIKHIITCFGCAHFETMHLHPQPIHFSIRYGS